MTGDSGHPTILLVREDREFRHALIRNLEQNGYLVLEARDGREAEDIAIRHSRRIHLLLADDSDESRVMAATLKPFLPSMNILHVSRDLEPGAILSEVFRVLEPPGRVSQDEVPTRAEVRAALSAEVEKARQRFLESTRALLEVAKDVPSGIPHPDGVTRLERQDFDRRRAFDEYMKVLGKLQDHLAPADSKSKPKRKK